MFYMAGVTLLVNPPIYLIAGSKSEHELKMATFLAAATAFFAGGVMGYSADVFNDLLGLASCERKLYPVSVREREPQFKRQLAVRLTALSMAVSGLMYALTPPDYIGPFEKKVAVEQTVHQNSLEGVVFQGEH
jgi:hypothetical protein